MEKTPSKEEAYVWVLKRKKREEETNKREKEMK